MDPLFVQNVRYKLQKRISRLYSADTPELFISLLIQFWRYFDQQITFVGIIEMLLAQFPNVELEINKIFKGESIYGESEEEAAAIGYCLLRRLVNEDYREDKIFTIGLAYNRPGDSNLNSLDSIREIFLDPFYEYIDEQLDDQRATLALLLRYKHRSEWFHRDNLWELSQVERKGEKNLALNLYSYLYDQGIDFSIEPSSISGEIDLIAAQKSNDPLLLDTKIFDGDGRDKYYLKKGFNQIYTYTQQFNEPFGYLVIYNITDNDLCFSLKYSGNIPLILHNHKTIFFIIIDIYRHCKPVSQRPPMKVVEITEEELIEKL